MRQKIVFTTLLVVPHIRAKMRHRRGKVKRKSGEVITIDYNPTENKDHSKEIVNAYLAQVPPENRGTPWEGPVGIVLNIEYAPTPSWSEKRKKYAIGKYHTMKPDVDNVEKMLMDALSGLAWKNDSQISYKTTVKTYGEAPRVAARFYFHKKGHYIGT